jgi:hypothetical protein
MKNNLLAASVLTIGLATATVFTANAMPAGIDPQPSSGQLKQMAKDAHTPEQYSALAQSYGQLQKTYLEKAAEEKQEWDRRSQNIVSIAAKYPRPVDSARNLYEYYRYKANEAGSLAAKYSQQAVPPTGSAAK